MKTPLKRRIALLYYGASNRARLFRYGLLVFDLVTVLLFFAATAFPDARWIVPLDIVLAAAMIVELAARLWVDPQRVRSALSLWTLADVVVIFSLLAAAFVENLGFLRVLRALRLLRSYHLVRDLRAESPWFKTHEDIILRSLNLVVFIFIVTSTVYVTQHADNPGIKTYVDALYFTITTLTTTGFGDVTLQGAGGRLLSVLIMVIGVSLFLQLLQAIFRPRKVRFECPDCALLVHEIDAVHCKHCGRLLKIPDEGI